MVQISKLSYDSGVARYEYQPEKTGEKGILAYNVAKQEISVEKKAEKDVSGFFYRAPILHMLMDCVEETLPEEKLLAWY